MFSISNISDNSFGKVFKSPDSIQDSIETTDSLSSEQFFDSQKSPQKPSDCKFLFESLPIGTNDHYNRLFIKLEATLIELEEALPCVNIRDDCTIKAKPVLMKLPGRPRIYTLK
ncbi:hypothetical protein SteCoe_23028 [Stentor coeruleus]|uniref:Uncharacterized protein n=1 Tax=Stentor coeruleus TaxID=5963 RepID=A0A1R2BKY0_9CILI|nr:hypothetical protein SteCoe_23028 [Stentor coeruleus]